jgi:hypothetical protein
VINTPIIAMTISISIKVDAGRRFPALPRRRALDVSSPPIMVHNKRYPDSSQNAMLLSVLVIGI